MTKLKIVLHPDPVLRETAKPVDKVDAKIAQLMDDMLETMYDGGVGLAAPQVGILKRVIVMDCALSEETPQPISMANPEIVWQSEEEETMEEGCLSVPGVRGDVTRPATIRVTYLDEKNKKQEREATGLLSACIQHEIDHLNGIMFFDYLSRVKRNMLLKKYKKMIKDTGDKSEVL